MLTILAVAVAIQINNLAGAPPVVVRDAVREVARVYAGIGVQVDRIEDGPAERDAALVHVILVRDETGALRHARDTVMGATIWTMERTPIVYVFYRRVEAISAKYATAVSMVFACTLAHELGHVLMPDAAHAPEGLMRATWRREELQRADQGQLQFQPDEIARIHSSTDVVSAFPPPLVVSRELRRAGRRTVTVRLKAGHDVHMENPLGAAVEDQRRDGARHQLEKHDCR